MNPEPVIAEPVVLPLPFPSDFVNAKQVGFGDFPTEATIPIRSTKLSKDQYDALSDLGFSKGMAELLSESISEFALMILVIDNSGSMSQFDGHKLVPDNN